MQFKTIRIREKGRPTLWVRLPVGFKKIKLPFKKKWMNALFSGEYTQVRNRLRDFIQETSNYGYCCLGVLSKVQGRLTEAGLDGENGSAACLSQDNPVAAVLGSGGGSNDLFEKNNIRVRSRRLLGQHMENSNSFMGMNDDAKASFKQIAKVIDLIFKA